MKRLAPGVTKVYKKEKVEISLRSNMNNENDKKEN